MAEKCSGLEELGKIIRAARGEKTYREFQQETGVSHASIRHIERAERTPGMLILAKLAPHTPYTVAELQAIALGEPDITYEAKYLTAKQLLPVVLELPRSQVVQLIQLLVEHLGKT